MADRVAWRRLTATGLALAPAPRWPPAATTTSRPPSRAPRPPRPRPRPLPPPPPPQPGRRTRRRRAPPPVRAPAAATEETAATPGVGDLNATPVATDDLDSCPSAVGRRVDSTDVAPATTTTPTPTATTPDDASRASAADASALARPFSAASPWNTSVDTLAVDRRSREWIQRAARRIAVVAARNEAGVDDDRAAGARPAAVHQHLRLDAGDRRRGRPRRRGRAHRLPATQLRPRRQGGADPAHPPRVDPLPEFDGWYSVIDESAGVGYDMWRARRVGDVISYQFIKRWLLDGPGFSPPATKDPVGAVGARGSGLPLFAGVIHPRRAEPGADRARPGDLRAGTGAAHLRPARLGHQRPQRAAVDPRGRAPAPEAGLPAPPAAARRQPPLRRRHRHRAAHVRRDRRRPLDHADALRRPQRTTATLLQGNELQGIRLSDLDVVQTGSAAALPAAGPDVRGGPGVRRAALATVGRGRRHARRGAGRVRRRESAATTAAHAGQRSSRARLRSSARARGARRACPGAATASWRSPASIRAP